MKDDPIGTKTPRGLKILETDIRGVTFPPDQNEQDGYQIRFLVQPGVGPVEVWSDWYFLPYQHLPQMIQGWADYMHREGHLQSAHGKPSH